MTTKKKTKPITRNIPRPDEAERLVKAAEYQANYLKQASLMADVMLRYAELEKTISDLVALISGEVDGKKRPFWKEKNK